MNKQYIGDSVYVEQDDDVPGAVILTTNNGTGNENTIFLDPDVIAALFRVLQHYGIIREEKRAGA